MGSHGHLAGIGAAESTKHYKIEPTYPHHHLHLHLHKSVKCKTIEFKSISILKVVPRQPREEGYHLLDVSFLSTLICPPVPAFSPIIKFAGSDQP